MILNVATRVGRKTPCKTQGQDRSAEEKSGKDSAGALIEQLSRGPMACVAALCNGWMPEEWECGTLG